MGLLDLWFDSGETSLSVRHFETIERISDLFEVTVIAVSPDESIDLDAIVGKPAALFVSAGAGQLAGSGRRLAGICAQMEMVRPEASGVSTYRLRIVPALWQLTQRRNHRTFQHLSVPQIVDQLLGEWQIAYRWVIDQSQYPKLELRVQYGETDYDFLRRMLEEAGITFFFEDGEGSSGSTLVLHDGPDRGEEREGGSLRYLEQPTHGTDHEYISDIHLAHEVRAGAVVIRDHDFRSAPEFKLEGKASVGSPADLLEQHVYAPGAFLVEGGPGGGTPVADDKGVARHDEQAGKRLAQQRLDGLRASRRLVSFRTDAMDVRPGAVFCISDHPRGDLGADRHLLATELRMSGKVNDEWTIEGRAAFADAPFRPPQVTQKPRIQGVESAIVVGPEGEEIHTDEFARVRVQFHWDRYADYSDKSSCWVRVSQGWAGSGFGMIAIPRIGQEVLVTFIGGNPDQPVIVGRLYNNTTRVPYKLPENKTVSGWKSDSSPGSNGYNEIRFDDARGRELLAMQAERNLEKVVKVDERELTGRVRVIEVGQRLVLTTGGAAIVLDGSNIHLEAKGDLTIKADRRLLTHGGPLTQLNPCIPRARRGRVKPPRRWPPCPRVPGVVHTERYREGIAICGVPEFRDQTREMLDRLNEMRTGRAVMKKIDRSGHKVTIEPTTDRNAYVRPKDVREASWQDRGVPGKGSDSVVSFNPSYAPEDRPPELALGHALISAWHNAVGEREVGMTDGVKNETLKTLGLPPYSRQRPCVNTLRRDLGLPMVESY